MISDLVIVKIASSWKNHKIVVWLVIPTTSAITKKFFQKKFVFLIKMVICYELTIVFVVM